MAEHVEIPVPPGWEGGGSIPATAAADVSDAELDEFTEDLVQLRAPNGAFVVDVGWYPDAGRDGEFACRFVEGDDWDMPIDACWTSVPEVVVEWIEEMVAMAADLMGEPNKPEEETEAMPGR